MLKLMKHEFRATGRTMVPLCLLTLIAAVGGNLSVRQLTAVDNGFLNALGVLLLAGFDPLMMGYRKEENPFLPGGHLRGIFNLAGIVNPAILLQGRVVGKWKEKNGKVEFTAFEPLAAAEKRKIAESAETLFTVKKVIWA